jgi:hypothetical protein
MKFQKICLLGVFLCGSILFFYFLIQASELQQKEAVKDFNEMELAKIEKERDFLEKEPIHPQDQNVLFTASVDSLITYSTSILWSEINNIFVEGNYAYCAFVNGLGIIDVSDSTNPVLVSSLYFPSRGEGIFVQGDLAYLADGYWGLQIIDVSDPLHPISRGHYDTPGYSWDVFVKDNYAYLADDWHGVFIVDVSDPDHPEPVWNYDTRDYPRDIFVQGNYAYVADSYGGLFIIDASNPTSPDTLGRYSDSSFAAGLFVKDTLAYIANWWVPEGFEIFNIKNPNQPQAIGSYPISGEEVFAWDTLACEVGLGWLHVLNVVNPSQPELVGAFYMGGYALGVWVRNGLAYVAKCTDGDIDWFDGQKISGLEIINIKYTPHIWRQGSLETPWVKQVFIQDNLAYVLVKDELKICNISDPAKPEVLGSCPTSGSASKIFVEGDIACIADTAGLQVFYVKNPSMPFWVGSYPMSRPARDVFVKDTLAYVIESGKYAQASGKLRIVNVANPLEPESVGTYSLHDYAFDFSSVFILDTLAYVGIAGLFDGNLHIVSISNPQNPYLISYKYPAEFYDCADIVVKDGFLYAISSDYDWFYLPLTPSWMSATRRLSIKDSLAYVTCGTSGLKIVSIADPHNPYVVTSYNTPGFAYDVFLVDDHIYLADKYSLMVLESHFESSEVKEFADEENIPLSYSLCQNYPNPFNPETNIEFTIPKSEQVKIEIFNILGQKVRTLVDEYLKAGHKVVNWNGKDDSDKYVSSGIYLYRIEASEFLQTKKMVLLR